mmetsp:Transcript_33808/g.43212  ORF Transcript_33808/g.43212 Transcript_33808/m.43212 type:complete len:82 (+) Transcript_33808:225-470(+)
MQGAPSKKKLNLPRKIFFRPLRGLHYWSKHKKWDSFNWFGTQKLPKFWPRGTILLPEILRNGQCKFSPSHPVKKLTMEVKV